MPEDAPDPGLTPPGSHDPALNTLLSDALRRLLDEGKRGVQQAKEQGRSRIRMVALQRDLDAFWTRLGKVAYRLAQSGEIDHPALEKAVSHIDEIEQELDTLRAIVGPGDSGSK